LQFKLGETTNSPNDLGGNVKSESYSNIRCGYRQGKVGSHTDGGMEFAHGRSERDHALAGHEMGKQVKAHTDGGMEGAKGRSNQLAHMGRGKLADPTSKSKSPAHVDYTKEHSRGVSKKGKAITKSY
jgi:hypothetical protein